ncbi:MAG: integration host factor subunit beta [Bacteroidales bacterium]|nr:integration host factor subunit beta [Bacteroidales bacterium]
MVNSYAKQKNEKKCTSFLIIKKIDLFLHPSKSSLTLKIKKKYIMTKAEIVNEIAKSTGLERIKVQSVVENFMESVKNSLAEGENVYLRGFGSFTVKKRAKKTARNISKNTTIVIPEHNVPAFKPAKTFIAKVSKEETL